MDAPGLHVKALSKSARGIRSLFSKAPSAAQALDRAARLLRRKLPGQVAVAGDVIKLDLHPASGAVELRAGEDGALCVDAPAAALGPGYVRYVVALLDELLDEVDFVWDREAGGYVADRDVAALEQTFLRWLQAELGQIRDGGASRQLGMPQVPRYVVDAPVLTPMGPRSKAWCDAVLADGAAGRDFWPLWDLATPAALARARALWLLWMEVPWRLPMGDLEEEVMEATHRELSAALRLAPEQELPWAEWAELVDYLDLDDEVTPAVRERGVPLDPVQGYRRYPAYFDLTAGWSLLLTPNFADSWQHDGASMVATDGERSVRCSCAEADGPPDQILAKIPMRGEILARLEEGGYHGRVEAVDDEDGLRVLTAIMTTEGSAAIVTIVVRRGDEEWGLATWRTLERASAERRADAAQAAPA
ncbi:MAG: hypothetical protein R3B48_16700 [Kofleriaceae bacterium]